VKHLLRRRTSGVSALAFLMAALFACRPDSGPILIGLAGPFTDSVGAPMLRAARLAVQQINGAGGIRGRPVQLVARDDFGDPDSAVSVASYLVGRGVVAVVGDVYSGTTLAAAPVYNGAGILQISPSSTAPQLSQAGKWTFRVCPSDVRQARALARFAVDRLGLHKGTILYLNTDYGRGLRHMFDEEFSRLGGQIDAEAPYLAPHPEVAAYLERAARRDRSDFIFLAGNQDEAAAILEQARTLKIAMPFLGGDGLEGLQRLGPVGNGTYISNGYLSDFDSPENHRFVAEYETAYPRAGPPSQAAAATFDVLHLLQREMTWVGTDRRKLRDAVAEVGRQRPAFHGVTGDIAFDEHGDVPEQRVVIGQVANGAIRAVEGL